MSDLGRICKHDSLARSCELCERDEEIARLTAEVERLRASKERLATCVRAYEAWNQRLSKSVYCDGYWPDHEHRKAFFDALTVCHAHNDLAPPAKEDSDG